MTKPATQHRSDGTPASDETPVNDQTPGNDGIPTSDETPQKAHEPAQPSYPKSGPVEPNRRDFSERVTVAQIRELKDELLGIKRDIARQSPQPEWFTAGAMKYLRDAYKAAALGLPNYREATGDLRAADLRTIDEEYLGSLIESIKSALKHLVTVMASHNYDQDWIELLNAVSGAANAIEEEVLELAAEVGKQIAKNGPVQENTWHDSTSAHDIHNRAPAEKL
jgi:hypothetical protein